MGTRVLVAFASQLVGFESRGWRKLVGLERQLAGGAQDELGEGLVEAGQIELDQPVRRYLPEFTLSDPDVAAQITVRELLNQTSGLPEWNTGKRTNSWRPIRGGCGAWTSSSTVRQLAVGNEPMTPARQAAFTSAGPDTRNIGAAKGVEKHAILLRPLERALVAPEPMRAGGRSSLRV